MVLAEAQRRRGAEAQRRRGAEAQGFAEKEIVIVVNSQETAFP